ncbi:MAG: polysaccharide biosynthesis C-terminal domain-containing protein [Thermoguttaceae bacterium]
MSSTQDTNSRLKSLLKGVGLGLINHLCIGLFLGLVLSPYIVHSLGDRYYAINVMISAFVGSFSLIDMGLNLAVSRYFTQYFSRGEKQNCIELSNTAFFMYCVISLVAFVFIILGGLGLYFWYPTMEDRLLILQVICINGIAFAINFPLMALTGVVNGTLRQELTGFCAMIFRLIAAALSFLVLYLGYGLFALALVNLIVPMLNLIAMRPLLKIAFPEFTLSRRFIRFSLLPKLFSYGASNFLIFLAETISQNGGLFVISALLSLDKVTPYSLVSMNLSGYFIVAMSLLGGGWLINWFTYLNATEDMELFKKSIRFAHKLCTFSATFMLLGIIFWAPDFVTRWVGPKYLVAYPSLVLLALAVWVFHSQTVNTKILFAIAKHHFLAYLMLIGSVINILGAILFVSLGFGINSVAMSTLIVETSLRGGFIPYYVCRIRKESYLHYLLQLAKNVSAALISWIPCYIFSHYLLAPNYPMLFLNGFLCACAYIPCVFLIGFNRHERKELLGFILKRFHVKSK